jgi:hypothetical protein
MTDTAPDGSTILPSMSPTHTDTTGTDLIAAVAAMSKEERRDHLDRALRAIAAAEGEVLALVGEVERNQDFRDDGATSTEAWLAERYGVSASRARTYVHVGEKASGLPHLVGALCAGEISFDKVRVVADVATRGTERRLCDQAKQCTVRELADIARSAGEMARASSPARGRSEHDQRFVRFNDEHRTISMQLPSDTYAETRARVEAVAKEIPSEADTPWDHRCADALTELVHSAGAGSGSGTGLTASPYVVVIHAPLEALVDESGEETGLAGDLERHGLIDIETVKRITCDATMVVALDDHLGHTMYEGRARRFPTAAQRREVRRRDRCCRFPGCANVTFAEVHHIEEWKPKRPTDQPGGRTDLPNLVLLCKHHHGLVHRNVWTMKGNANEELTFDGPSGRVMTSRPSSKWTRVTAGR